MMYSQQLRIIRFALLLLYLPVFGQSKSYPFEIKMSGNGKRHLIFIPGFASSGDVWDSTVVRLQHKYRCHVLTMAGFAGVPPQVGGSFESWKDQIIRYIQENKIEEPIIVGHSMGGALALAIASEYPNRIKKIIVVDAVPYLSVLLNPSVRVEKSDCYKSMEHYGEMNKPQFRQQQKHFVKGLVSDPLKQALVVSWTVESDRATLVELYCDFASIDLRDRIKTINCPTLVLLETPFKNIKSRIVDQYKNLSGVNLQYANQALHFIMYDDPEWYQKQLHEFLNTD